MTRADAIKNLESCRKGAAYVDSEYVDGVDIETVDMALETLVKMEIIQKIVDEPFEWEQDDRRRYLKVVDIVRRDLA